MCIVLKVLKVAMRHTVLSQMMHLVMGKRAQIKHRKVRHLLSCLNELKSNTFFKDIKTK